VLVELSGAGDDHVHPLELILAEGVVSDLEDARAEELDEHILRLRPLNLKGSDIRFADRHVQPQLVARTWYADGRVADWNPIDLGEYLLDFVPCKVGIEDGHVERFPEAVAEVFRFLSATGRLEAEAAEHLGKAAVEAADRFVSAARDPSIFGLAKAMTSAMLADGVDLADEAAVQG